MTRLLVLLVVVVAVVVVAAEIVVPPRIEEVIAERVAEQVPEAESVRAELDSFPVVARGLGTGEIQRLVVTLEEVARPELTVDRVQVEPQSTDRLRPIVLTGLSASAWGEGSRTGRCERRKPLSWHGGAGLALIW